MFVPRRTFSRGPGFRDPQSFSVSRNKREGPSNIDAVLFPYINAIDLALTLRGWHNLLCDSDIGAWVKRLGHCR